MSIPPDKPYLLGLPLRAGSEVFTFLAFLGGLSAATAMVVVETVALSIMVCNDLLMPLILKRRAAGATNQRDMSGLLLNVRRAAILSIILLAYALYDKIGNASLAEIGLLSFSAIAQFAPAFFIGLACARHGPRRGCRHSRGVCGLDLHAAAAPTDRRNRGRRRSFE